MKPEIENHPAVRLGRFLKDQRIGAGLSLRDASNKIGLAPSKLSELELGIGDHLTEDVYWGMQQAYRIDNEGYIVEELCEEVSKTDILTFADVFDENDVLPAFIPLDENQRNKLLTILGFRKP